MTPSWTVQDRSRPGSTESQSRWRRTCVNMLQFAMATDRRPSAQVEPEGLLSRPWQDLAMAQQEREAHSRGRCSDPGEPIRPHARSCCHCDVIQQEPEQGWCPRRDSNSHDRSRGILNPLRLPLSPLGPELDISVMQTCLSIP